MRKAYRANNAPQSSQSNCITPTLIAVIIVFIILVAPAKILSFFYYVTGTKNVEVFNVILVTANVMRTLNFSINFVLYCAVNKKFRSSIRGMLHCRRSSRKSSLASNNGTCSVANKSRFSMTRMSVVTHGRIRVDNRTSTSSQEKVKTKAETATLL